MFQYTLMAAMVLTPVFANAKHFRLSSTEIAEGEKLAIAQVLNKHGCKGENISPSLKWSDAPDGTKSFVVTAYDPDAPTGSGWWHWVVFNIPATATSLPLNAGSGKGLPEGAIQSRTDAGAGGYVGACPLPGQLHRYIFTVHALKTEKLPYDKNASAALVGFLSYKHGLAKATITATYARAK